MRLIVFGRGDESNVTTDEMAAKNGYNDRRVIRNGNFVPASSILFSFVNGVSDGQASTR